MKKILLSLLILFLFNQKGSAQNNTSPPLAGKWKLILNEEFNEFNPELWSYGDSWKDPIPPNNAINFFNDKNVKFNNGRLVLTTKKDELLYLNKKNKVKKYNFSTGAINSFGKFKFKYGYIEAAIRNPVAKGLWSAFWLIPDRRTPSTNELTKQVRSTFNLNETKNDLMPGKGMEIDIMEQLSEWSHKKYSYAIHWDGYKEDKKSFEGRYFIKKKVDDFVRFGLYWAPEKLIWFANGEQVAESNSDRIADVPMYIILNGFVGGWAKEQKDYQGLPDTMEVDYLRVWQLIN